GRGGGAGGAMLNASLPQHGITFMQNVTEALEIVRHDRNKVYIGASTWVPVQIRPYNCELVIISDSSFPEQYDGIFYSKSAQKWLLNPPQPTITALRMAFERYNRKYMPDWIEFSCMVNPLRSLQIEQIASPFYFLVGGLTVTTLAFIIELLLGRKKRT